MPPLSQPTMELAKRTIFSVRPPCSMNVPASMKNGSASSENVLTAVNIRWDMT